MLRSLAVGLLGLSAAFWTGCELPVSVHPLSDRETSEIDACLFGSWDVQLGEPSTSTNENPIYFGRLEGQPKVMEMVTVAVADDGEIKIERGPLYVKKLGPLHCLSLPASNGETEEARYSLVRYEVDGRRLKLFFLSKDKTAAAIERKELAGELVREVPNPKEPAATQSPRYKSVLITAETPELIAYFEKHGKAAFDETPYATLHKLTPKADE